MSDTTIDLYCPKCHKKALQTGRKPEYDGDFTCGVCGHVCKTKQLVTAEGKTLLEHGKALFAKTLSGVKGFKPRP